jgi:hypothetical protein
VLAVADRFYPSSAVPSFPPATLRAKYGAADGRHRSLKQQRTTLGPIGWFGWPSVGDEGANVVAAGTPKDIAVASASHTAKHLEIISS